MKISFNPSNSNKNILDLIKSNKDIIFDLKGHNIFARGVEFKGTDTNTWRPVVDNLTSNSTTSSLSANQGRVLAGLINGKSDSDHNHDGRYVRAFGTSNDNIDSDWGQSFKTFDPIPSGTPPEQNPNISLLNIGNDFNRRKQLAFIYSSDSIYYRRHTEGGFSNWRRLAFANEIPTSLKNPHALTISLNGTSQGPYDGSAAKNINITPSSIGAATSGHNHDGRYVYNYGGTSMDGASKNKNALGMSTTSGISGDWWHILQAAWNDEYRWNSQIAFPTQNRNGMYYRSGLDDNTKWGAWVKLLDTGNSYVTGGKGVINGTTITQVDNAINSTNSTNARKLVNWYSARPTSLNAQFGDGSLRIFYATSSTTEGKSPDDATVLHLAWDNNGGWDSQLAISSPSSRVYSRSQNGGTWQPWKTLAFTTDIPSSLKNPHPLTLKANGTTLAIYDGSSAKEANFTYANVGAASASHTHSYYAVNENYGGFKKAERLPTSGFYQSYISGEDESGGNAPWTDWIHLINCQHSNTGNNFALQIAASFHNNNIFKIRVTNNNVNAAWRDIIHSGNIGSQTVASASKLQTARNLWGNSFNGTTDVSGTIKFNNVTSGLCEGVQWTCGDNDYARLKAGATGSNAGYFEIATSDDGNEPIYVRQYTGVFSTVKRTLTLLDANGFTHFPSYINIGGNENNNSSPDRVWGSNSRDSYLRSYRTSALRVSYASSANTATSANKLTTARNIALGTDLRGSANFDGSNNIIINANINACAIGVGSTNGLPFKRIAHFETGSSYNDNALLLYISQGYINGSNGICRVEFRTGNISSSNSNPSASASVRWLVRNGYGLDSLYAGYYVTTGKAYIDIYLKTTGGYQGTVIRVLQDSRGGINSNVQLINSHYYSDSNHKEAYNSIEAAATALYNKAYTRIVSGSDVGTVSHSNSTGSVHWNNVTNKPSSFTPSSHTHTWSSITDKIVAGNEFNIVNAGYNNQLWFNYLPIDNRNSSAAISQYNMCNGNKGLASVYAYRFKAEGKACMWKDARNYAPFYATFNGGFEPILDIKTKGGDWSIGSYDSAGDRLIFSFTSDSDFNAGVNGTAWYYIATDGIFSGASRYINHTPGSPQSYMYSTSTGTYDGAIQIREVNGVLNNQSAWGYAPRITFHWGQRYAKGFGMRSDGQFAVDDVPIALTSNVLTFDNNNANYLGANFNNPDFSKKAASTYIECWDGAGGWWNWMAGKFMKAGSSDAYVLLGGGGHKPLSQFQLGSGSYLPYNGWWNSGSGQDVNDANGMIFAYASHKNSPFSSSWGIITTFDYTYDSNYKFQLAADGYSNAMYYRSRSNDRGGWTSWAQVIDTGNISSQRVAYATSAGSVSNSLNIFGVSYNGSAAKTVTTSTFVSQLPEGTSTVTDGTMFITSWASDSGFADTNAVNVPYKRKASCLWNYIDSKVSSKYLPLAGGTMNGNARIGHGSGNLYIGNSGNDGWVYTQDIASQSGTDKWWVRESGAAHFGNVYICTKSDYTTYNSSIIECYTGNNLYLNYYSPRGVNLCNGGGTVQIGPYTTGDTGNNKLFVNGSEFIQGASNVKDHVFANGFRHRSHNSNDSVLLAGGGYSQGVPVRYWAIYSMYIGNSSTDVTYTRRGGNYDFITSKIWESEGVAIFDINFPSGYNRNNTLIFGNGDHRTSSQWKTPVYATITTHISFGSASKIRVMISDDANLNTGFANIYFMCMG